MPCAVFGGEKRNVRGVNLQPGQPVRGARPNRVGLPRFRTMVWRVFLAKSTWIDSVTLSAPPRSCSSDTPGSRTAQRSRTGPASSCTSLPVDFSSHMGEYDLGNIGERSVTRRPP